MTLTRRGRAVVNIFAITVFLLALGVVGWIETAT
jgi:hypothetical protein